LLKKKERQGGGSCWIESAMSDGAESISESSSLIYYYTSAINLPVQTPVYMTYFVRYQSVSDTSVETDSAVEAR
jgi:hypothetical protein